MAANEILRPPSVVVSSQTNQCSNFGRWPATQPCHRGRRPRVPTAEQRFPSLLHLWICLGERVRRVPAFGSEHFRACLGDGKTQLRPRTGLWLPCLPRGSGRFQKAPNTAALSPGGSQWLDATASILPKTAGPTAGVLAPPAKRAEPPGPAGAEAPLLLLPGPVWSAGQDGRLWVAPSACGLSGGPRSRAHPHSRSLAAPALAVRCKGLLSHECPALSRPGGGQMSRLSQPRCQTQAPSPEGSDVGGPLSQPGRGATSAPQPACPRLPVPPAAAQSLPGAGRGEVLEEAVPESGDCGRLRGTRWQSAADSPCGSSEGVTQPPRIHPPCGRL